MERRQDNNIMSPPKSVLDMWIQYEKLLKEAVLNHHYHGLVKLMEFESAIQCLEGFKRRCYQPLALAINRPDVPMINLFLKNGYGLSQPQDIILLCFLLAQTIKALCVHRLSWCNNNHPLL